MATLGKELAAPPSLKRTKSIPKSAEPVRKSRRHPDNLEGLRLHYDKSYLTIRRKLGSGSYGDVYAGVWRGERVAVKVELQKTKQLLSEHNLYKALNEKDTKSARSEVRFLKTFGLFHFEYSRQMINAMVFARAGASLEAVIEDKSPFSEGLDALTVCSATAQLIDALRAVHDLGFIHRDITPRNILLKRPAIRRSSDDKYRRKMRGDLADVDFRCDSDVVYLIDFGLAKAIPATSAVDHRRECREPITNDVVGTPRYCSKRAHRRRSMCERDDLLSLIYVAVFVKLNALPWASRYRGEDRNKLIGLHKARTRVSELCESAGLPPGLCSFAEAVDNLAFGERPRYSRFIDAINADMETLRATDKSYLRHVADSRRHGECFSELDGEGVLPLCAQWNREHEYDVLHGVVASPFSPSVDELEEMRIAEAMARASIKPSPRKSPKRARPRSKRSKSKAKHEKPAISRRILGERFAQDAIPGKADGEADADKVGDVVISLDLKKRSVPVSDTKKRSSLLDAFSSRIRKSKGAKAPAVDDEVASEGLLGESPRKKRKLFV